MTIRELAQRLKMQRETDVVEQVRTLLVDVLGEHTVYKPTSRWQQILSNLGISDLESIAVCVTCYSAGPEVFETIKNSLKKKYKTVAGVAADELGYRQVIIAGSSPDSEPQLLLLANYYEEARDVVKSLYGSESPEDTSDKTNAQTDEPEDLELDLA